jgi:Dolichyl-phosphate-mannose-protein mannosyltransferase
LATGLAFMRVAQTYPGRLHFVKLAWGGLFGLCLTGGVLLVLIFSRPYPTLQTWTGWMAPDGELESFTLGAYNALRSSLLPLGVGLLLAAGLLGLFREHSQAWLERFGQALGKLGSRLRADAARLAASARSIMREEGRLMAGVALLTLLAALLRGFYLSKPMGHDETYTYMAFASQGLWTAISDYHLPNNHVFHTLLVLISTQLFGNAPWAIRLPAFLFGVLTIPATALLALVLYGRRAALLSAAVISILPVLIDYSSAARGYSGMAFFTVVLLLLAVYVKERDNLAAWGLFILAAALGFFNHPAMLYPFGMVMTWLFLSWLFKDVGETYGGKFLYYLVGAGLATVLLTLLLYTPLFIASGPGALVANNFVEALSWRGFEESVPVRVRNTWLEWNRNLPAMGTALFAAGLVGALLLGWRRIRYRIPIIVAALLWIGLTLVVQRVAPWPRVWLFLLPLFVMWAAAGWVWLLEWVENRLPGRLPIANLGLALLVVVSLGLALVKDTRSYLVNRGDQGYEEEAAQFLEGTLQPGDVLLLASPDATVLRYYLERNGVPWDYAEGIKQKDFKRALVVVNRRSEQTPEWLLERKGITGRVDLGTKEVLFEGWPLEIYAVRAINPTN